MNREDSYNKFIMDIIFLHRSIGLERIQTHQSAMAWRRTILSHLSINPHFRISINSKKFVLKIWSDVTDAINVVNGSRAYTATFLGLIVDSVFECRKFEFEWTSSNASMESHPFLKVVVEASRENDGLAKVVDIIKNLAFQPGTDQEIEEQLAIEIGNIFIN